MKKLFVYLLPLLLFVLPACDKAEDEVTCESLVTRYEAISSKINDESFDCDDTNELYEILEEGKKLDCEELKTAVEESDQNYELLLTAMELSKGFCDAFSF